MQKMGNSEEMENSENRLHTLLVASLPWGMAATGAEDLEAYDLRGRINLLHDRPAKAADDAPASLSTGARETTQPPSARPMERSESEWLGSRRRPSLKRMKSGSRQEERNFRSRVRQIHRDRRGLEPLPDQSRLGQITADRAVRFVASPTSPGDDLQLDGSRWMGTRIGPMVDAKHLVQARPGKR